MSRFPAVLAVVVMIGLPSSLKGAQESRLLVQLEPSTPMTPASEVAAPAPAPALLNLPAGAVFEGLLLEEALIRLDEGADVRRVESSAIHEQLPPLRLELPPLRVRMASREGHQTGRVIGRVVDAGSGQGIGSAQVHIPDLNMGVLSDPDGSFALEDVPAGVHELRVQQLGYGPVSREITVTANETTEVNFELAAQALALDQIVVTGTAGGTQRRAIGNVVDQIQAREVLEVSPATSVNQLIQQRSPGVMMMPATGTVGAGAPIHIRGTTSMSLGATPIIYIDGVRMDSRHSRGPGQRGGSRVSRLDDLNLEDIESIEIIKGPAAATLYGTEASNGVIQIVTRRGQDGSPQFDITARTGTHWLWNPEGRQGFTYTGDPYAGQLDSMNVYAHERDHGLGAPFQYGSLQDYSASVQGGTELLRYFASASWRDQVGVFDYNWEQNFTGRSNLEVVLSEDLSTRVSLGYVQREYRGAQRTLQTDAFGNMTWGSPEFLDSRLRGFRNAPPEASAEVDARSVLDRVTASVEFNHTPRSWLTHRLITGIDVGEDQTFTLYPRHPDGADHFWGTLSLGNKSVSKQTNRVTTFDYGASASARLSDDIASTTSVGFQYYRRQVATVGASGAEFAAPPLTTVTAGADRSGSESFSENATVGVFVQQQFDWRNRVFLTGAVRGDDNSAFGADFDAAIYPKVSATWVMHEEPFWNVGWMDQFRVRAAWGAAGQQPSTFAAVRLYSPVTGYNDEPGLQPSAIGNFDLKPERSEELEWGFDAGFLQDRVQVIFTRYDRTVRDAMVGRPLPPSEGFPGSQTVNLGKVKAWGNELELNARVLDGGRIGWDLGASVATMRNRIEDLGAVGPVIGTGRARQVEGFSISDMYWRRVVSADFVEGDHGPITNLMCDGGRGPSGLEPGGAPVPCEDAPWVRWGHTQPTWQVNVNQTLTLGPRLRLYASVDANGGHLQVDATENAAHTSYCISRACRFQDDPIFQGYRQIGRDPLGTYKAGFARLREVSATYTLPTEWVGRVRASRGSVSLAGRNMMMLWTAEQGWSTPRDGHIRIPLGDSRIWDPEVRGTGARSSGYQTAMPPLASAVLTFRLSF